MTYDPRKNGAKCDECPLKGCQPIAPVKSNKLGAIIVGSPGLAESEAKQLIAGRDKYRLSSSLKKAGADIKDFALNAATLCHPPHPLNNKQRKEALACCRPRLANEIREDATVIAIGKEAFLQTTGHAKLDSWMGTPLRNTLPEHRGEVFGVYDIHNLGVAPAFIPVFDAMIARGVALSRGALPPFKWPELITGEQQTEALLKLLALHKAGAPLAIDIESRPSNSDIRCIGVGVSGLCVSVPFEQRHNQEDRDIVRELISIDAPKVFQNAAFDLAELRQAGYIVRGFPWDTLLMHATVAPRLPHDLSSMMAYETWAERWKTLFKVESDDKGSGLSRFDKAPLDELLLYNAKDVAATLILFERFTKRLSLTNNGEAICAQLHELSGIAMKMKAWGLQVDQSKFDGHREYLTGVLRDLAVKFRTAVPDEEIQLGKGGIHISQQKLFFDQLKAPVVARNEDGKPQLNAEALVTYTSMLAETNPFAANLARTIYQYRKHAKLLGSYIENLPIGGDGRVHPAWRVFGTRTGRWSATDPGIQTIPKKSKKGGTPSMRDLFSARPGFTMVEADYSQLELRIVALLSGDEKLLEWYAAGIDVHTANAKEIFKTKTPTDGQRDLAKRVVYGMNYGGSAKTIWRSLTADIPVQLEVVELVVKGWFSAHPKIEAWQAGLVAEAQKRLYVEEALSGRRQYYYDGRVRPTEVLNYPVQGAAGELANRAVMAIAKQLNWEDEAIIAQVHDSVMAEAVTPKLDYLVGIVKGAMEQEITLNGASIRFPVDVKVGTNWAHLEKLK